MEVSYLMKASPSTIRHPPQQIVRELMADPKRMNSQIPRCFLRLVNNLGVSITVLSPREHKNAALFFLVAALGKASEGLDHGLQNVHAAGFGLQLVDVVARVVRRLLVVGAPVGHIHVLAEGEDREATAVGELLNDYFEQLFRRF